MWKCPCIATFLLTLIFDATGSSTGTAQKPHITQSVLIDDIVPLQELSDITDSLRQVYLLY